MPSVEESPCPQCGECGTTSLTSKLYADPIGEHAQAGHQLKVNAGYRPVITCTACGLMHPGEYDPDGVHVSFRPLPPREGTPHGDHDQVAPTNRRR
jgi:hypothetical protein